MDAKSQAVFIQASRNVTLHAATDVISIEPLAGFFFWGVYGMGSVCTCVYRSLFPCTCVEARVGCQVACHHLSPLRQDLTESGVGLVASRPQ